VCSVGRTSWKPKASDVALAKNLPKRVRKGTRGERAKIREKEELVGELIPAMEPRGHDSAPIWEMDGWLGFRQWLAGAQTEVQTRKRASSAAGVTQTTPAGKARGNRSLARLRRLVARL
jgi:hypothetical protein